MRDDLRNAWTIASITWLLGAAATAAHGATLKGRVLDGGPDDPTGIAAVTVTAYDATDKELGHTDADSDGYYSISGLPTGAVRVKFDLPGYVARPTWRSWTLTAEITSEDVPMLQEHGSPEYIHGLARRVAAKGGSATGQALKDAWQEFDQFQLPADVRQQLRQEVIEQVGPQAAPFLEEGRVPPTVTTTIDYKPPVFRGVSPTLIGPVPPPRPLSGDADHPPATPARDPAKPATDDPGKAVTVSTEQKAKPMAAEQGTTASPAREEKAAPANAEQEEAPPPPPWR